MVEVFRRTEAGQWLFQAYGPGQTLHLTSVDGILDLADIYADVALLQDDPQGDG